MKWGSFIQILKDADNKMKRMVDDLPQFHGFLKRSHLVVTRGSKQFDFKMELSVIDMTNRVELLAESKLKSEFENLVCLLNEAEKLNKNAIKAKAYSCEIDNQIKGLKKAISEFPIEELEIADDIDIQIRFPGINMPAIQKIKGYARNHKTCMCQACIIVSLV